MNPFSDPSPSDGPKHKPEAGDKSAKLGTEGFTATSTASASNRDDRKRIRWTSEEQEHFVGLCAEYQLRHPGASLRATIRPAMEQMPAGRRRPVLPTQPYEKYRERIDKRLGELRARQEQEVAVDWGEWEKTIQNEETAAPAVTPETDPVTSFSSALRGMIQDTCAKTTEDLRQEIAKRLESIERDMAEATRILKIVARDLGVTGETAQEAQTSPASPVVAPESAQALPSPAEAPAAKAPELLQLAQTVRSQLGQRVPHFDSNVIMGFKAVSGGQAAHDLVPKVVRAYVKFLTRPPMGSYFSVEESSSGREYYLRIKGPCAYGLLAGEAGTHRFEVKATHTSKLVTGSFTITVLPERLQGEFRLLDKDLKIETTRSRGPGGQHVNTTETAVRLIHVPTNESVEISSERSQQRNLSIAKQILGAKLAAQQQTARREQEHLERRSQIGAGHAAGAIRTLDFLRNEVIDTRLKARNLSPLQMKRFLGGDLEELLSQILRLQANGGAET